MIRKLLASAAKIFGFRQTAPRVYKLEDRCEGRPGAPMRGDVGDPTQIPDKVNALFATSEREFLKDDLGGRRFGVFTTSNPTGTDNPFKDRPGARTERVAEDAVNSWRQRNPSFVTIWRNNPVTSAPGDYDPRDLAEKAEAQGLVNAREAARIAGLAYWVEGPKDDGLFWLYHRKTPDDLAEPVRGYTRRRNAQAQAARMQRAEAEALEGLAEIAKRERAYVEPTPDGKRFDVKRDGAVIEGRGAYGTQRLAQHVADHLNGEGTPWVPDWELNAADITDRLSK